MKKRYTKYEVEDNRKVVVYARKSVITNKGESIKIQIDRSQEYARNQLQLPEDYKFEVYEDLGKSGYYSDRASFQRMIHDIEKGKIKAIACYKLDRIGRRTSDLLNLLNFLEKYKVVLLVCSNNINTQSSASRMLLHFLAMIAEYEREILTERINDNLIGLAQDGRFLGGITPTGFSTERATTGTGQKRSALTYLVPIPEERELVKKLFALFLETRSINRTAVKLNDNGYTTKNEKPFTQLAVKDIIRNPVYCVADERAYQYFQDAGGNMFGEKEEYTGKTGISVYNRTNQMKEEDDDSTFLNPSFTQRTEKKPMTEWIVAVGRHEGFIESDKWIEAQRLLDAIADDQRNRPHRKSNALLSGIIYCPNCGRPLNVLPQSNRWTHGKPRFTYSCLNARQGSCSFKAVRGVELDEFIIEKLCDLSEEENEYYQTVLQKRIDELISQDETANELTRLKKEIIQLEKYISAQVKNLRDASEISRKHIQVDIDNMSQELEQKQKLLSKLKDDSGEIKAQAKQYEEAKRLLLSFKELAENSTYEDLVSLIHTVIERVYIVPEDGEQICHIYVKGSGPEDYNSLFGLLPVSDILGIKRPYDEMCNSDRYSELYTYLCGDTDESRMQPADGISQASVR